MFLIRLYSYNTKKMFPIDCNQSHETNLTDSCCIKHLIEMYFFAENQLLGHKYAKLLTQTLNHNFKQGNLKFDKINLETAKIFLDILSKYVAYYSCLNQLDLAKLITKIALKLTDTKSIKDLPEIHVRKAAVFNNLSAIYESIGKYEKSLQYLKMSYKYLSSEKLGNVAKDIDMAIFYNNLARISLKQNKEKSDISNNDLEEKELIANQAMKMCYEIIREESLRVIREKSSDKSVLNCTNYMYHSTYNRNTFRLIGFLYYNYGCFLSNSDTAKSVEIYKQGYEFLTCTLNGFDEILSKFRIKLQFINFPDTLSKNNLKSLKPQETFESKYESDVELPPVLDRFKAKSRNKSQEVIEKNSDYNSVDVLKYKNNLTFNKNHAGNNGFPTNYEDMMEIKNKVDMLLNKFEELKNVTNPINIDDTSNSQPVKIIRTDKKFETRKEINNKNSSVTYDKLKHMIKPKISKLISDFGSKSSEITSPNSFKKNGKEISVITKKQTNFTEEYLQELINEFENSRGEINNSKDSIKLNDLNRSKSSKSSVNFNLNSDNLMTGRINDKDNTQQIDLPIKKESSKTQAKSKRNLKDLFTKVIPEQTLKKIEKNMLSNQNADDGKIFHKLITNLINENDTNIDVNFNKQQINPKSKFQSEKEINHIKENLTSSNIPSKNVVTSNNTLSKRNSTDFKNNISGITPAGTSQALSNDNNNSSNLNFISANKSSSDQIKPQQDNYKISVNQDNENIDLWEAKTFYIKRSSSNDKIKNDLKIPNHNFKYNINLQLDQEEDKYEPKTFYIKNTTNDDNKNSSQKSVANNASNDVDKNKNYEIIVELDNEDYSYKPKTFYMKRRPKTESNENTQENKTKVIDESFNTHFTANFGNNTNTIIDHHKELHFEKSQMDSNNYSSEYHNENILNDEELKKIEKEKFMTFTINNDVRMITLDEEEIQNDSKNLIESENIFPIDYNTFKKKFLENKKRSEKDFPKHFENLLEKFLYNDSQMNLAISKQIFSIIRELDNSFYKISIGIDINEKNEMGLQFRLYRELTKESINQSFITFEKLKNSLSKLSLYNSLSMIEDLFDLNNLEDFLQKHLIYHCNLHKTSKNISIGLLTRPIGLCANSLYEFTFLNEICFIDILILQSTEVKFTIYNKKNEKLSLGFDLILGKKDFQILFKKYYNKNFIKDSLVNENIIDSYEPLDEKYMIKEGFIADIIIGIEKYLTEKMKIKNLRFDDACQRLKKAVFEIHIKEDLKKIELWSINCDESSLKDSDSYKNDHIKSSYNFNVDFLTFKPIHVKNDKINVRLHHLINDEEFRSIFGYDNLKIIQPYLSDRDMIIVSYILLNSLKLNFTFNQLANMSKNEIRKDLKIISTIPLSLLNYSYITKEQTSLIYVTNLEYLLYNNFCSFYRLSLFDTLTGDTFVKIIKYKAEPKKILDEESFLNEIKTKIKSKFDFTNFKSKNEFKKKIDDYFNQIHESETFSLFDTVDNFSIIF